jgi:hypothetical protein
MWCQWSCPEVMGIVTSQEVFWHLIRRC